MVVGSPTKLNLIPSGVMPVVYINQGDAGYDKEFLIYNGDTPYNVPSGVSATIRGTKADGFGVTEAAAVTEGSNLVTVTITEQMVAAAGENLYELVFVDTNDLRVASINMVWAVKKDALGDSVISDSDLDYATTVMNQLQSVQAFKNQLDTNTDGLAAETAARIAADNTLQSNINAEAATRATTDTSLQAQINQIIAPSGEAPSAAEVQNARIGADGVTYQTLGEAIRTNDTELKNAIYDGYSLYTNIENGTFNNDGTYNNNSSFKPKRLRTKFIRVKYGDRIEINNGNLVHACGAWIDELSSSTIIRNDSSFISAAEVINIDFDGYYIIVFAKTDNTQTITPSEFNGSIKLYNALPYHNKINADKINDIQTYNNLLRVDSIYISSNKWAYDTRYCGIFYPVQAGDEIVVVGASGHTSYIRALKNNNHDYNTSVEMSEIAGWDSSIGIFHRKPFYGTIPEDCTCLFIYGGINLGALPSHVFINGYDILNSIQGNVGDFYETPVSLKIMQYNIGKFTFGYANHSLYEEANLEAIPVQRYSVDEYITHYRQMLCKYHPDLISLEEYNTPVSVIPSGGGESETVDMGSLIFDFTYPNTFNSSPQRSIKSKIGEPFYTGTGTIAYEYGGQTLSRTYAISRYLYYGRPICVICTALASTSNTEDMEKRALELSGLIDKFNDEEYVFFSIDMNNGGNWVDSEGTPSHVTSKEEGKALLEMAEAKGWTFAQGSYLPFTKTWIPPEGSPYTDRDGSIDNIVFKNNGKIVLKSFEVLSKAEYDLLSTDHCAVIGDFMLF